MLTFPISLTPPAARKAWELISREDQDGLALRISVKPGGCSGLQYSLFFDDKSLDGDIRDEIAISNGHSLTVVLDPASVPYLTGSEIDFVDTLEKQGFIVENPNATNGCGCGNSFC
jgi:iron-sulfur cluster assembly accessory protein